MNLKLLRVVLFSASILAGSATSEDRCGVPGLPANGNYGKTNVWDTIDYFCVDKREYRLIGIGTRHCQPNGTWASPIPRCEPNLFYKMADIHFRGGDPMIVMLWEELHNKTGTFAEIRPETIDILLPKPTTIKNLTLTVQGMLNAASVDVTATMKNQTTDPGYNCTSKNYQTNSGLEVVNLECPTQTAELVSVFSSGPKLRIFEIGIYGNTSEPDENCGTPDIPANGYAAVKDGTVNYTCNQEFKLVGKDTVTCKGGQWSDQAPVCTYVSHDIRHYSYSSVLEGQTKFTAWIIAFLIFCLIIVGIIIIFLIIYCRTKRFVPQEKINHQTAPC